MLFIKLGEKTPQYPISCKSEKKEKGKGGGEANSCYGSQHFPPPNCYSKKKNKLDSYY